MSEYLNAAASFGRRNFDLVAMALILAVALAVRLADLGSLPANLTADELDDLQNAYRVIYGRAGGFFGLDWNQAPNLNMYLKAASIEIFGDSVAGTRMYGVVLSMASLAAFYPLARRRLDPLPALVALFLMATSLWFLHFSRTPWVAASSVLAAILAAYFLDLAIERQKLWLFALLGATLALGAYGYFAGRTLVFVVMVCYFVALLIGPQDRWRLTQGFALAGVTAFVLFAPQLWTLLENWDYANKRPNAVSVFRIDEYLGDTGQAEIILHQAERTVRGFLLLDESVSNYGLWERHRPVDWAFIDPITGLLYWVGLIASIFAWRRYVYWWAFLLIPLAITQVFSVGTPDGSRGLIAAPFMFLFAGLGVQTVASLVKNAAWRGRLAAAAVALALAIGAYNVDRYFDWINDPQALAARRPAVEVGDFVLFRTLAREYAREGRLVGEEDWLHYRQTALEKEAPR